MPEYDALSVRLNKETMTLEQIDKRAEELGLNRSQFVTLALQMMVNFDLVFWQRVQKYSTELHIPEWMVIQNMLIERFGREAAKLEVWGRQHPHILDEFTSVRDQNGVRTLTGGELFDVIKKKYYQIETRKKIDSLLKKETHGIPLKDEEKQFLKKRHYGKAWLESEEYKNIMSERVKAKEFIDQAQQEGLIAKSMEFDDSSLDMIADLLKSEMSKEVIINQINLFMESINEPFEADWESE